MRAYRQAARLRHFQQIHAAQEGRFTRSAGADQGHHLALGHVQRHTLEHMVIAERFVNSGGLQDGSTHRCAPMRASTRWAASVSGNSTTKYTTATTVYVSSGR